MYVSHTIGVLITKYLFSYVSLNLGKVKKKIIDRGQTEGGRFSGLAVVIVLRFFSSVCSKPICVAKRSPKTYFVFTPNSIYLIFSKLFDPVNLTSHFIFFKIYLTGSLCFYGFHGQKGDNRGKRYGKL